MTMSMSSVNISKNDCQVSISH